MPTNYKPKVLKIIFTRDFNLWVNQLTTDLYHNEFPKVWGKSLKNQIITYNGRVSSWCRFESDVDELARYMVKKPLTSNFFQLSEHQDFRRNVRELRKLIEQPVKTITNPTDHLKQLTRLFSYKFTFNSLGVFLPGLWKEEFLRHHTSDKPKARKIVQWALETRRIAEGIHKEVGDHMRKWLGPMLETRGYPARFVKLLTIAETRGFITSNKLPSLAILQKRSQGFVYMQGKLCLAPDIKKFFAKHGIELAEEQVNPNTTQLKGSTAYPGEPVRGKVRVVMNSDEVKFVRKGEILVSPMTSPDYLQAMQKSSAIVTDEGGITCHAAIVARELKIPCIIGTRVATKVLKNGDTVTVDARTGTVTKVPTRD